MNKATDFSSLVMDVFAFLAANYEYKLSICEPLRIEYRSDKIVLSILRETQSGWIGVYFALPEEKSEISLEEIADHMGGALNGYKTGLHAYDLEVAGRCLQKLADTLQSHLHKLLQGDLDEFNRLHSAALESRRRHMTDMQFGGLRMAAQEAWDSADFQEFMRLTSKIETKHLTESEKRRQRIAEIKIDAEKGTTSNT